MIHVRSKLKLGLGVVLTAALLCSLVLIAAPVGATDPATLTKAITTADDVEVGCDNPMSGTVKFVFTYDPGSVTTAVDHMVLIITGPTPYTGGQPINLWLDASGNFSPGSEESMMEMGIVDRNVDGDLDVGEDPGDDIIFIAGDSSVGEVTSVTFWLNTEKNWSQDTDDLIMPDYAGIDPDWDRPAHTSVWPMGPCIGDPPTGQYNIAAVVYDASSQSLASVTQDDPLYNDPYMMPSLGIDVKGSVQCFYAKNTGPDSIVEWTVLPGVNSPQVVIEGGGGTDEDWICIASAIPGDAIVKAYIDTNDNGVADLVISGEKKWGDIDHTELDADETNNIEVGDTVDIDEMVYATIHWGSMDPADEVVLPAGGALVHWWLVENTDNENQEELIELLEDIFPGTVIDDHPYYDICGDYEVDVNPFAILDDWASAPAHEADHTEFIEVEGVAVDGGRLRYVNSVTDDSMPGETRGWTQTTIDFYEADPGTGLAEEVMVVVLAEYPLVNMFHGENPVCVEIVKITPEKRPPEITEVKTPQVRWAGEKIILEKDWSDVIGNPGTGYVAIYHMDEASIGTLYMGSDNLSVEMDGGDIWVGVTHCDPTSEVILESEFQGKADVEVALYKVLSGAWPNWVLDIGAGPIVNTGFFVYFLAFEDVALEEDISHIDDLTPGVDAAEVAVQVKGWFTSDRLPLAIDPATGAVRAEKDGLPRGRYVLPDDWAQLAGYNYALRPNWDLMDRAHLDGIVADTELGPYDTAVVTTTPPGEADNPCIGPFNTLQPWSILDMWIADNVVPADFLVLPGNLRNTVVPDGLLNWYDAPMPQALVIFDIVASSEDASLSGLDKGNLEGYGYVGDEYQSPFYAAEIPSSQFITPLGYNWDSWNTDGPYDYWTDLVIDSIISNTTEDPKDVKDVEVYCDNHGIAGVTIDALEETGHVTITVTAEFPNCLKKGQYPPMTVEIDIPWGAPPAEHLNPDFEADPREGDAPLLVTFDPTWTWGGLPPYVKTVWDFGDGSPLEIIEDAAGILTMLPVTHLYGDGGLFSPSLEITDSTLPVPLVHTETKWNYIDVAGEVPPVCVDSPAIEVGLESILADPARRVVVYHEWAGVWTGFDTAAPAEANDLTTLEAGKGYWISASTDCTLDYYANVHVLTGGLWYMIGWQDCD